MIKSPLSFYNSKWMFNNSLSLLINLVILLYELLVFFKQMAINEPFYNSCSLIGFFGHDMIKSPLSFYNSKWMFNNSLSLLINLVILFYPLLVFFKQMGVN